MSFFKKNTFMVLVFVVFLLVVSLVIVTSYYQSTVTSLSKDYYDTKVRYDTLISDLDTQKSKLNDTLTQVQIKEEREKDLSEKFSGLRQTNEEIATELDKTSNDLTKTKNMLAQTQADLIQKVKDWEAEKLKFINTQAKLDNVNTLLDQFSTEVDTMDNKVDDLGGLLSSYQGGNVSSSCTSMLDQIENYFDSIERSKNRLQLVQRSS